MRHSRSASLSRAKDRASVRATPDYFTGRVQTFLDDKEALVDGVKSGALTDAVVQLQSNVHHHAGWDPAALAKFLYWAYESSASTSVIVEWAITREISSNKADLNLLFREDSLSNQLMAYYFLQKGGFHLTALMSPFMHSLLQPAHNTHHSHHSRQGSAIHASTTDQDCKELLALLCADVKAYPSVLRAACHRISAETANLFSASKPTKESEHVKQKFNEAGRTVVGSFFFLRFVCAILLSFCSDIEGQLQTSDSIKRVVLLIRKVQQIANTTFAMNAHTQHRQMEGDSTPRHQEDIVDQLLLMETSTSVILTSTSVSTSASGHSFLQVSEAKPPKKKSKRTRHKTKTQDEYFVQLNRFIEAMIDCENKERDLQKYDSFIDKSRIRRELRAHTANVRAMLKEAAAAPKPISPRGQIGEKASHSLSPSSSPSPSLVPSSSRTSHVRTMKVPAYLEFIFERGEAHMDKHYESLSRDIDNGIITIGGERYICVRGKALTVENFCGVHEEIAYKGCVDDSTVSTQLTHSMQFDMGYMIGRSESALLVDRFTTGTTSGDGLARFSIAPSHFAYIGLGVFTMLPDSQLSTKEEEFALHFTMHPTFQSTAWMAADSAALKPALRNNVASHGVCSYIAGYVSGFASVCFDMGLVAVEVSCRARGNSGSAPCEFILSPPRFIQKNVNELVRSSQSLSSDKQAKKCVVPAYLPSTLISSCGELVHPSGKDAAHVLYPTTEQERVVPWDILSGLDGYFLRSRSGEFKDGSPISLFLKPRRKRSTSREVSVDQPPVPTAISPPNSFITLSKPMWVKHTELKAKQKIFNHFTLEPTEGFIATTNNEKWVLIRAQPLLSAPHTLMFHAGSTHEEESGSDVDSPRGSRLATSVRRHHEHCKLRASKFNYDFGRSLARSDRACFTKVIREGSACSIPALMSTPGLETELQGMAMFMSNIGMGKLEAVSIPNIDACGFNYFCLVIDVSASLDAAEANRHHRPEDEAELINTQVSRIRSAERGKESDADSAAELDSSGESEFLASHNNSEVLRTRYDKLRRCSVSNMTVGTTSETKKPDVSVGSGHKKLRRRALSHASTELKKGVVPRAEDTHSFYASVSPSPPGSRSGSDITINQVSLLSSNGNNSNNTNPDTSVSCHFVAGYIAGWINAWCDATGAASGLDLSVAEVKCAAASCGSRNKERLRRCSSCGRDNDDNNIGDNKPQQQQQQQPKQRSCRFVIARREGLENCLRMCQALLQASRSGSRIETRNVE
eukprot:TRINITY_DN2065_c0_g1_i1.p1 TRINITY_DN2065_c0_g1~~TRINITY_DN2065_c0_g1_i1.p1  ORF type:complete len:1255 (-),score=221.80 TRINITY_DN2065_c0_g1_i1:67-3831(-)